VKATSDNLALQVIRYGQHIEMPWKNGFGVTREICRLDDEDGLLWRASIATVDRSGPFSLFSGCDRTIVLLEGDAMALRFEDGEQVQLQRGIPYSFSCERPVAGEIEGQTCRDLNLIWRRKALDVTESAFVLWGSGDVRCRPAGWHLLLVAKGEATVEAGPQVTELMTGDAILFRDPHKAALLDVAIDASEAEIFIFSMRARTGG
jgi:environmental stress-induced protein Ves